MFIKKRRNDSNDTENYSFLFHKKYNLSCIERHIPWELSSCILKDYEEVLLQGSYKLETADESDRYGTQEFHFYVIEINNRKYLKIVDVLSLEKNFGEFGGILYSNGYQNIPYCEEINYGVFTPEYKKYACETAKEFILDDQIDDLLKEMKKIDFKNIISEVFTCDYRYSLVHYDCYDFYNKRMFCADGYCLEKYSAYVDLIDYIFSVSKIKHLISSKIKLVKSLDVAYEEIVKKKRECDELDLMIE